MTKLHLLSLPSAAIAVSTIQPWEKRYMRYGDTYILYSKCALVQHISCCQCFDGIYTNLHLDFLYTYHTSLFQRSTCATCCYVYVCVCVGGGGLHYSYNKAYYAFKGPSLAPGYNVFRNWHVKDITHNAQEPWCLGPLPINPRGHYVHNINKLKRKKPHRLLCFTRNFRSICCRSFFRLTVKESQQGVHGTGLQYIFFPASGNPLASS